MRIRLFGQYFHASIAVLAATELMVSVLSLYVAVHLRYRAAPDFLADQILPIWPRAVVFGLTAFVSFTALGLYSARQRARVFGLSLRLGMALVASAAAIAIVFYVVPGLKVGRGVIAIATALTLLGSCIARLVFARVVDGDVFKKRVLVLGSGLPMEVFAKLRRRSDRRGYMIVGFLTPGDKSVALATGAKADASDGLLSLCLRLNIDEVVIAMEDRRRGFPAWPLIDCRLAGIDIIDIATFLERETARVQLDVINPSWMIFGDGFRRNSMRLFSSRAFDLAISSVLFLVTFPIMVLTSIAILIEDGVQGGIFYRQERIGYAGRKFALLKFRSMRVNAEIDGTPQWAKANDPRVTRVGAFIRKSRIDELPQILNVLRGDMSFVGPRPERPHFVEDLTQKIPYYGQRHTVKPGITGWAQLCYPYGASEHDALQKLQYDLYYIKNSSLLFDLAILVQTAEVVFLGKGAR